MIKPKPCPFCGEEPIIRQYADNGFSVTCLNHEWYKSDTCGISIAGDIDICASIDNGVYNYKTEKTEYTQEEIERCKKVAIETWNKRAGLAFNGEVMLMGDRVYLGGIGYFKREADR